MSKHIVLNIAQKQYLDRVVNEQKSLFPEYCWVETIAIKNDLWILPEECLYDKNYESFAQWLGEDLNGLTIREVTAEELIQPPMYNILN